MMKSFDRISVWIGNNWHKEKSKNENSHIRRNTIFASLCLCPLAAVGVASAAAPLYSDAHFAAGRAGSLSWADCQSRVEAIDFVHVAVVL
jgi:hypothetical protein